MKKIQFHLPVWDGARAIFVCIADAGEAARITEELARHNLRPLRVVRSMVACENGNPWIAGQKIKYLFRDAGEADRARRLLAADRTREPPGRNWIEARKQPGKIGDLLAAFIRDKFADELAAGAMNRAKLRRYEHLYQAFYQHRRQLPPELRDIPAKTRRRDRRVAGVSAAEAAGRAPSESTIASLAECTCESWAPQRRVRNRTQSVTPLPAGNTGRCPDPGFSVKWGEGRRPQTRAERTRFILRLRRAMPLFHPANPPQ